MRAAGCVEWGLLLITVARGGWGEVKRERDRGQMEEQADHLAI